jgi:glycosyltransferase involved in cell wall biosynthesis
MRLGMLTASLSPKGGGVAYAVNALSQTLRASSIDVSVFATADAPFCLVPGLVQKPTRGPSAFGFTPGLSGELAAADLDLLHVHGLWMYPSVLAQKWASAKRKPHIVSPHGMLEPWALANSRWKKRGAWTLFERANLARAPCLHALTESEALDMRRMGLKNPIAVIPNGVDIPPDDIEPRRPTWLHGDGRALLLYLGRIHPKKGLVPLIEAWRDLAQRRNVTQRWVLAIAGWDDGGHLQMIEAAIRAGSLEGDILLPGPLYGEAKETALRHARAFILPSLSEGLPIAVLEAWSYGRPVFMTRACGLPEGFQRGAALEISADPCALAGALADGLEDDRALSAAGARGRELAERKFAWSRVAADMAAVYRWLTGAGPRPATVL